MQLDEQIVHPISLKHGFFLLSVALLTNLGLIFGCRQVTQIPLLASFMLITFTLMLSIGLGRLLSETVEGVIIAFTMTAVTVTLLFYATVCQCYKRNGDIAIVPGVIISGCVSIIIMLLSSFCVSWDKGWHPLALIAVCTFYGWYLLYDTMEMVGDR